MEQKLVPGQNCPVPSEPLQVTVSTGREADISSFRLHADGKTRRDEDFVFYGQTRNDDGTVTLDLVGTEAAFAVDVPHLAPDAEKLAFTATTTDSSPVSTLGSIVLKVARGGECLISCTVDMAGRSEAALILGELYRRGGAWKFRFVSQGFDGGLRPLAEHFGVDVADPEPSPAPAPAPAPAPPAPAPAPAPAPKPVSLSKVVLTKEKPRVDLAKKAGGPGLIRVNLNWNRNAQQSGGILGHFLKRGGRGVDLDLGAYVRLKNGRQTCIQALGGNFGSLGSEPYIQLQGDDRTGDVAGGEWLHINGERFAEIDSIVVYAFIYEGVPNWGATDGVVRIHMPGHEIETHLTEGSPSYPMCAIASIANLNGDMRVERLDRYFRGHRDMDAAFGWGFNWVAGRK